MAENNQKKSITPRSECLHDYSFISSSRGNGAGAYSHLFQVCRKCGEFDIQIRKDGVYMRESFVLVVDDQIEAASQYLRHLRQDED